MGLGLSGGDRVRVCSPYYGYHYDHLGGKWNGDAPTCEVIQCPDIADPFDGQIDFSPDRRAPFDYGTLAEYSCDDGFNLIGDVTVRECVGDSDSNVGYWTGNDPICQSQVGAGVNSLRSFERTLSLQDGGPLNIVFEKAGYKVIEGESLDICMILKSATHEDATVNLSTSYGTAQGDDYISISQSLSFTMTNDRNCVSIQTNGDFIYEGDEELTVFITHSQGFQTSTIVIIKDDDEAHLSFSGKDKYTVCEGEGEVEVKVKLNTAIEKSVVAHIQSISLSAKETLDYEKLSEYLTFKAPQAASSELSATVKIIDNNDTEPCEMFIVRLSSPSERAVVDDPNNVSVHIYDDEDISEFSLMNHSPKIAGASLAAQFKLMGCARLSCNISNDRAVPKDCSPPVGSFEGNWTRTRATRRRTTQHFSINIEPYCKQQAPTFKPRPFRIDNPQCGVHFTDQQCIVNEAGDVIVEWQGTGPTNILQEERKFKCKVKRDSDKKPIFNNNCTSPHTIQGLTPGKYSITVFPVGLNGCHLDRHIGRKLKFEVTN